MKRIKIFLSFYCKKEKLDELKKIFWNKKKYWIFANSIRISLETDNIKMEVKGGMLKNIMDKTTKLWIRKRCYFKIININY